MVNRTPRAHALVRALAAALVALICLVPSTSHAQSMGGFLSPGELSKAHHEISGVTACLSCHDVGAGVSATKCMSCHDTVRDQVRTKQGFHADKGTTCERCHPDHRGSNFDLIRLDPDAFDHTATGFALRGAHSSTACEDCHTKPGVWTGLSSECVDCHRDDEPHGLAAAHDTLADCASCHGEIDWGALPLVRRLFDHNDPKKADFKLHGQHTEVPCEKCHIDWRFAPIASEACTDCHDDPHRKQFAPRTCEDCHTVERADFALRDFDHSKTDWPLTRPHKSVSCEACHGDGTRGRYVDLPHETCGTCHDDPHGGQFAPRDCDSCHDPTLPSFALSSFNHDATSFPLRGAHATVACEDCHGEGLDGTFAGLAVTGCESCHDDPHEPRFAPQACDSCHQDAVGTWAVEAFDHALTGWALTGGHASVECVACHGEGEARVLQGLAHDTCTACHADDNPHGSTEATATCTTCHVTDAWTAVALDHTALTGFALDGAHAPLTCTACHEDVAFQGEDAVCASCHETDRPVGHFPGGCGECHLSEGWRPATLGATDHASTGFALKGAHAVLACKDCHAGQASTGPFCLDCHADDDPHRNLLGNTCETCHGPIDWSFVRYNHAAAGWPLRGSHAVAACVDCHATGYIGTPTECRRCHESQRPNDALHADPLTRDCEVCHRPYAWEPARWPHGGAP